MREPVDVNLPASQNGYLSYAPVSPADAVSAVCIEKKLMFAQRTEIYERVLVLCFEWSGRYCTRTRGSCWKSPLSSTSRLPWESDIFPLNNPKMLGPTAFSYEPQGIRPLRSHTVAIQSPLKKC